MFNKIILVGNLTRDIELRYSQGGMGIASTAIATSHKFTVNGEKKEEVCFVDITFFGRSAEVANQYLRKGSKILVEGRLKFDQWVDQNGQKRSKHGVTVVTMQMLDSKGDNSSNQGSYNNSPVGGDMNQGGYPQQGQQQAYQPPVQQQQQSYGQNESQQSYQQPSYNNNQAQAQSRTMPSSNDIPTIDIDEDEIPF
ncbi:MAG: single-stranded DNA-binding protein [Campylobacterota bacterium]|nr:single-stranded DNA-binding protein [Campylobacterota bacterium]